MMIMKALSIGEARRRLPALVRQVAEQHRSVTIGRRGRAEVALVPIGTAAPIAHLPLKGLAEIVGGEEELERGWQELRHDIAASLDRTARTLREPPRRARR
jgi:prevent-host-death family protein